MNENLNEKIGLNVSKATNMDCQPFFRQFL